MPHPSALHVPRPRLVSLLDAAGRVPLVLVSGPAGSGKTSLLVEWLGGAEAHQRVPGTDLGWITFEDEDTLLWQPVLDCLVTLGLPYAATSPPDQLLGRARLEELVAAFAASGRRWTLVIDGYELRSSDLAAEVTFLLDHTGGLLRLVFAARVDPALPLYRYRLDAAIAEVRAAELRLTDTEAVALLDRCGVRVPPGLAHELNRRLGGWAAGLRFTARALARHESPVESMVSVVSQDHDIKEYLLAEVLQVQPPATRELLLRTCVPDVLPPGLAEQLAGPRAAQGLDELVRANMFLEPLADRPGSYRYHPFFRDLLRAQLAYEDPATAADLHRRAAAWLRGRGARVRSVRQLAAGGLWPEVARQLVDDLLIAQLLLGHDETLVEMARRIPEDPSDPAVCLVRAAMALVTWDPGACALELDRARAAAGAATVEDHDAWGVALAVVDGMRACTTEDTESAGALLEVAARALSEGRRPAGLLRPELEALLETAGAVVCLRRGELGRARAGLTRVDGLPGLPVRFRSAVLGYLALADALDGRLTHAERRAGAAEALADDSRLPLEMRNAAASAALALVALARDELSAARRHVAAARTSRALVADPVSRTVTEAVTAHVEAATHGSRAALAHLDSLCALADAQDRWLADWLRLRTAELAVANGLADQALHALGTAPPETPERAVVAAAVYAEQGRTAALERSLTVARSTARTLPVEVSRLLLQGVDESRRHSPRIAAPLVEQALELAARETLRRPFHAAPPTVRRLLAGNAHLVDRNPWLNGPATLEQSAAPAHRRTSRASHGASAHAAAAHREDPADVSHVVVEPLTAKEREVLTHLEELLTTEEIAERMFVSVNTIRTHVRSILRKLGVNRRNSAVRRARALGLLDHPLQESSTEA